MAVTDIQPFVHMDQFSSFSVSQEPPISFYPLDATTWDFPSSFVADSAHSTFSDAVWEVPAMEVDFPSTVMPIMSLESIKSSQTSTTTSGSMEPSVSEPFSPPSRSRSQSRERDDITRKQVSFSDDLYSCSSANEHGRDEGNRIEKHNKPIECAKTNKSV
jgi:hypothetical protein